MKTTIAITLNPEQVDRIKKESHKLKANFSETMRLIIDSYFDAKKK